MLDFVLDTVKAWEGIVDGHVASVKDAVSVAIKSAASGQAHTTMANIIK